MALHSSLTDPNIHEPKGASTAADGEVYVADGVGSGAWTARLPTQTGNSGKYLTTDGTSASWATVTTASFYFPFYKASGTSDVINLVSGTALPFYKASGSASNISLIS